MQKDKRIFQFYKPSSREKVIELTSILLLISYWLLMYYAKLEPHEAFNKLDTITYYSLPKYATAIYLAITCLSFFPVAFNYATPITPDNQEAMYRRGMNMLRYLKIMVVIVYMSLSISQLIGSTEDRQMRLSILLIVTPILCMLPTLYNMVSSRK
jgi:hypothetical protein